MSAPKFPRGKLIEGAKLSARIAGCTCSPAVKLRELRPGIFVADIAHDQDCRHPSHVRGSDA